MAAVELRRERAAEQAHRPQRQRDRLRVRQLRQPVQDRVDAGWAGQPHRSGEHRRDDRAAERAGAAQGRRRVPRGHLRLHRRPAHHPHRHRQPGHHVRLRHHHRRPDLGHRHRRQRHPVHVHRHPPGQQDHPAEPVGRVARQLEHPADLPGGDHHLRRRTGHRPGARRVGRPAHHLHPRVDRPGHQDRRCGRGGEDRRLHAAVRRQRRQRRDHQPLEQLGQLHRQRRRVAGQRQLPGGRGQHAELPDRQRQRHQRHELPADRRHRLLGERVHVRLRHRRQPALQLRRQRRDGEGELPRRRDREDRNRPAQHRQPDELHHRRRRRHPANYADPTARVGRAGHRRVAGHPHPHLRQLLAPEDRQRRRRSHHHLRLRRPRPDLGRHLLRHHHPGHLRLRHLRAAQDPHRRLRYHHLRLRRDRPPHQPASTPTPAAP